MTLLLLPILVAAGETEDAQRVLQLYADGDRAGADEQLEEFLRNYPDSEKRCELLSAASRGPLPLFEAIRRLRRVNAECCDRPEGARALADLARLHHLSGQTLTAFSYCREFLERYPDHELAPEVLLLQGALEMRYQGGRMAGNSFAVFLAKHPDHSLAIVALVGVADAKVKRGDWAGAHRAYQRALAADPSLLDLPKILFHLGVTAEMLGDNHRAKHYYQELIRLFPESVYSVRAEERMEMFLAIGSQQMRPPADQPTVRFAVCVGVFDTLDEAEQAARRYRAAGYKVHYLVRGQRCRLLIGEFTTEIDARLFAREVGERFRVQAEPMVLP